MRIAVWPADEGGCGHYRATWPAQALIAQGADVTLVPSFAWGPADVVMRDELVNGQTVHRAIGLRGSVDADVVVMQRPLLASRADLVELLQAQGVRVVVEIDDDFETIHPRNVSWAATHPRNSPGWNREHLARACRQADLVTVTTPMLAHRYGRHGRVVVVPNHVPASYLKLRSGHDDTRDCVSIGWTGSIDTHPTDLQVTRGAVASVVREHPTWPFLVVGTGVGVGKALGLPWEVHPSGWVPLDEYPVAMIAQRIGIVPLDDIVFNHSKSALKMMEYAALGVPVVASPTADNVRMHGEGIGLLAGKPKHWAAHLRMLIAEPDYRMEIAVGGRATMQRWTIEGNTDRWLDAWSASLDRKVPA